MKRRPSLSTIKRELQLLLRIKPIKADHPLWGYRRVWSYLKYRRGYSVGINRIHSDYERTQPVGDAPSPT